MSDDAQSKVIGSLPLPAALVEAMTDGRWRVPDAAAIERVFGEPPEWPHFHALDALRADSLAHLPRREWPEWGLVAGSHEPSDVDPELVLVIGNLGPDLPFVLDYRRPKTGPSVAYLGRNSRGTWVNVAESIEALLAALGLMD